MENLAINKKNKIPVWARILIAISMSFILSMALQIVVFKLLHIKFDGLDSIQNFTPLQLLILESLMFTSTCITVFILRKYVDKKTFISLGFGLDSFAKYIIAGFLAACTLFSIGTIILYFIKQIHFISININTAALFYSFLLCMVIAFNEELLVRGYILNNLLNNTKNKYVSLTVSALIFASMHLLNFNVTILSILNIFIAGIILGSVYIFTQSLWFSISLHLFWNFLQGPVLGYHVSGFNLKPMLEQKLTENNFINGGNFGFEGSIICTIITTLLSFAIIKYYKNKISNTSNNK